MSFNLSKLFFMLAFYLLSEKANAWILVETVNGGPGGYSQIYRTETWDGNQTNVCVLCSNPGSTPCPYVFNVNRNDIELINKLFENTLIRIKAGRLTGRVITSGNLICEWISADTNYLNSKIRVSSSTEPILYFNN